VGATREEKIIIPPRLARWRNHVIISRLKVGRTRQLATVRYYDETFQRGTSEQTTSVCFHETSPTPFKPAILSPSWHAKEANTLEAQAEMKVNWIRWWVRVIPRLSLRFFFIITIWPNWLLLGNEKTGIKQNAAAVMWYKQNFRLMSSNPTCKKGACQD